jgi:hypothetical protein
MIVTILWVCIAAALVILVVQLLRARPFPQQTKIHEKEAIAILKQEGVRLQDLSGENLKRYIAAFAAEEDSPWDQQQLEKLRYQQQLKERVQNDNRKKKPLAILDGWGAILPMRVNTEELGDYIEDIHERAARGQRWLLWVRVIAAIIWTGINTVGYMAKNLLGRHAAK